MEENKLSPKSSRPSRWKGCLVLTLIFSPLVALLLFVAATVVSFAFADATIELKRGKLLHEWLLEEPLSEFPTDLIEGTQQYFWSGGEISPSSITLRVDTPTIDSQDLKRATDWLINRGFTVTHKTSSTADFTDSTGRRASIEHTKYGDGSSLRINVGSYAP